MKIFREIRKMRTLRQAQGKKPEEGNPSTSSGQEIKK